MNPYAWPAEALERVLHGIKNLSPSELALGLESTGEPRGVSRSMPEGSGEPFGGAR